MAIKVGYEMKTYRDVSSTWTLMTNITNVELSMQRDRADVTTRAASGWKAEKPTLATMEVTFDMMYDPTDSDFAAFQTAFLSNTDIDMAFADGAIATTGTKYISGTFGIAEFSRNEPLAEGVTYSVTMVASDPTNPPTLTTVS